MWNTQRKKEVSRPRWRDSSKARTQSLDLPNSQHQANSSESTCHQTAQQQNAWCSLSLCHVFLWNRQIKTHWGLESMTDRCSHVIRPLGCYCYRNCRSKQRAVRAHTCSAVHLLDLVGWLLFCSVFTRAGLKQQDPRSKISATNGTLPAGVKVGSLLHKFLSKCVDFPHDIQMYGTTLRTSFLVTLGCLSLMLPVTNTVSDHFT